MVLMKKILKKIGLAISAFALMSSVFLVNDSKDVYADETITATFHFTAADANYEGYEFKAYTVSDGNGTGMTPGTLSGNEIIFIYPFVKTDVDEQITFYAHKADGNITIQENIDITGVTEDKIDIYVNYVDNDTKEITIGKPETTGADDGFDEVETEKMDVPDDPNADYTVGTVNVILLDVVFLVIIGIITFMVLGKEKKSKI